MVRKKKITKRKITQMYDAEPQYVSIVDHGANQQPFTVFKREGYVEQENSESKLKRLELGYESKTTALKAVDMSEEGMDIVSLSLSRNKFRSLEDVKFWLDDGGYEDYEIEETPLSFEISFPSIDGDLERQCFSHDGIGVCITTKNEGKDMSLFSKKSVKSQIASLQARKRAAMSVKEFARKYETLAIKAEGEDVLADNLEKAEDMTVEKAPEGTSEFVAEGLQKINDALAAGDVEMATSIVNDLMTALSDVQQAVPVEPVQAVDAPSKEMSVEDAEKMIGEEGTEENAVPAEPNNNAPAQAPQPQAGQNINSDVAVEKSIGEEGSEAAAVAEVPNNNAAEAIPQTQPSVEQVNPEAISEINKTLSLINKQLGKIANIEGVLKELQVSHVEKAVEMEEVKDVVKSLSQKFELLDSDFSSNNIGSSPFKGTAKKSAGKGVSILDRLAAENNLG